MIAALMWCGIAGAEPRKRPVTDPTAPVKAALFVALDGHIEGSGDITAAERDGLALADTLWEAGFGWVDVLIGEAATADGVRASLARMSALDLGEEDTALLYVATHGVTCPATGDETTQHLRVAGTVADPDASCWSGAMTDTELLTALRGTGAGQRVLVLEACLRERGSLGGASSSGPDPWGGERIDELVLRSTRYGLSAFQVNGALLYTGAFRAGLESLRADLDGDGAVTAVELHDYAIAVVAGAGVSQRPMRQRITIGAARDVVLAGTPGAPTRPVVTMIPASGRYSVGLSAVALGAVNLPVYEPGPLLARDALGISMRVLGVPREARTVDARPWIAGRRRGWPSLVVSGGVGRWRGLSELPYQPPATASGALGVREQLAPHIGASAEVSAGDGLRALDLGLQGELHWRRFTASVGPRAGVYGLDAYGTGLSDARGTRLGAEAGLRVGLAGPVALTAGGIAGFSWAEAGGERHPLQSGELRAGLLLDPGLF